MSLDELRVRALQALRVRLERVSDRISPGRSNGAWAPRAPASLPGGPELLTGAGSDPTAIARAVARLDPELLASFRRQSDAAEQGIVALLGYEPLQVGNPPRW